MSKYRRAGVDDQSAVETREGQTQESSEIHFQSL